MIFLTSFNTWGKGGNCGFVLGMPEIVPGKIPGEKAWEEFIPGPNPRTAALPPREWRVYIGGIIRIASNIYQIIIDCIISQFILLTYFFG